MSWKVKTNQMRWIKCLTEWFWGDQDSPRKPDYCPDKPEETFSCSNKLIWSKLGSLGCWKEDGNWKKDDRFHSWSVGRSRRSNQTSEIQTGLQDKQESGLDIQSGSISSFCLFWRSVWISDAWFDLPGLPTEQEWDRSSFSSSHLSFQHPNEPSEWD